MSQVLSFAEESCWDGERFREIRRPVVFVLQVNFPGRGMIRHEFELDYGVFYDVEDDWLVDKLQRDIPDLEWGWLVYHKKVDHSGINLINPDSGRVVGQIYQRGTKQQIGTDLPAGVASMGAWRQKLSEKRRSDDCPEG